MKINTAISFLIIALAFLLQAAGGKGKLYLSRLMAGIALVLTALTLLQYITGADFGVDQFLGVDSNLTGSLHPGRMSLVTVTCFLLLCIVLLTFNVTERYYRLAMQGLLHLVTLLSFTAIVGYIFNVPGFYTLSVLTTMAIHTAVAFFVLSIALSLVHPTVGITGVFTGTNIGNEMARRVFVQVLLAGIVLGYLRLLTHRSRLVDVEFGIALFAMAFILVTLFIIWRVSQQLNDIAFQKDEAESSLERAKAFLDATPDPVIITDAGGVIKLVNQRVETVFGYTKQQLLGELLTKLLPIPGQDIQTYLNEQLLQATENPGVELRALRKEGLPFWAEVKFNKIDSVDGFFVSVAMRDITLRKQVLEQLATLSNRFAIATTGSGIGIWEYKPADNLLIWDELMYGIYGMPKVMFDGKLETWIKAIHETDRASVSRALQDALNGSKEFDLEFRISTGDNTERYAKARAGVQRDADGRVVGMLGACWDITQRKQIELQLVSSNERNRIFVEQAPNAIAMFDTDMRYLAASRKWIEDYHLEGVEIIGRSHYDVFPEIGDDWKAIHKACMQGAIDRTDASPFKRADGTTQWLTWDVRPWYVSEGHIGGLLMFTADITAAKQREAERSRIGRILSSTSKIARIATWEVDAATGITTWSDMAYDILEMPAGAVPERDTLMAMCSEESLKRLLAAVYKQIEDGTGYDVEVEVLNYKRNRRWVRIISESDFENGVCVRRFGVMQDITKAKQAEETITLANEELEAIFNSGHVSIISTDTRGVITNFSRGAEILLQYTAAEMVGVQTPYIIHAGEEVEKRGKELSAIYGRPIEGFDVFVELARQGKYESREWTYVRKDGSHFPVQLIVSAIHNNTNEITGFLGVATDITERKQAEEKLRNYSILESKSKEMEQFAYIASHDLREPLLTIKSFAGLLDEEYGATFDEEGRTYINAILKSINRMEALTKGLLEYSRLGQIKPMEMVDCNAVLNDVVADLNSLITKTCAEVTVDELPVINGHALELKLLFQNLLNNAIKFRKSDTTPKVHVSVAKTSNGYRFSVEDNGIGISEKNREKIFVMFQRLHNRDMYEGTGIGLAQCKKIVEMHNGEIWVESEPEKYSRFCFTIST
ncbi:MAG TPA: PAS domain S-box protein [Chitinophagales bacterium]|nr:PAS domain S-box protein [Chitinophagales bacterium]